MRLVAPQDATPEEAAALDAEEAAEEGGETPVPGAASLLALAAGRLMGRVHLCVPGNRARSDCAVSACPSPLCCSLEPTT